MTSQPIDPRPLAHVSVRPGQPYPMGASLATDPTDGQPGVNFAVVATGAHAVEVLLSAHAANEAADADAPAVALALSPAGPDLWCAFVPGLSAGQAYQFRVHRPGPSGHPAPALLDPWAHGLLGDTATLANGGPLPWGLVLDQAAERAAGAQALALASRPATPPARTVLYEAHVKALTRQHPGVPEPLRGTYAGLACPAITGHLRALGITTVCLLPVHQHLTERHLLDKGLTNHWGYNPLNVFTPDPRFAACTHGQAPTTAAQAAAVRREFRDMVEALHRAGLEVVLDVVFNHSAEGDANGPCLSWRGLAPMHWYAHTADGQLHNFSGCGNSLQLGHPLAVQWVMDSLRWWVQAYGVDGFRFDLATSLGRHGPDQGYGPQSPLLSAMAQDPTLAGIRLVAEPWDLGPHGYQLGQFPPRWQEWNDRFRDTTRAFWLGHPCTPGQMARVLLASSDHFQPRHKRPLESINLITAHDGFTLADVTAYTELHNQANGERNRDGHSHNLSANAGTEGPSADPDTQAQRSRWQRALLATLLLAQGTPQLLAGDELGHTQHGNNNAYCQDNPTTWLNWGHPGPNPPDQPPGQQADLLAWVAGLSALRARYPGLRHPHWFTRQPLDAWPADRVCPLHPISPPDGVPSSDPPPPAAGDRTPWDNGHHPQRGLCQRTCPVLCPWAAARLEPDVTWRDLDGGPMTPQRWNDPQRRSLACTITVGEPHQPPTERLLLALNANPWPQPLTLPPGTWRCALDSASAWVDATGAAPSGASRPTLTPAPDLADTTTLAACSVLLLVQSLLEPAPTTPQP